MCMQLLGESTLEYMLEDITQFYNSKAGDSGVQVKSIFLLQVCYTKDHSLAFLILTSFAAEANGEREGEFYTVDKCSKLPGIGDTGGTRNTTQCGHWKKKKKGCFDLIWLPQFHTSSASLNTVETHCLLYIPNSD